MSLLDALTTAILPVLAVAAVGYLLGSTRDIDPGPLNTVTIYVLTPALVFYSLATASLSGAAALGVTAGVAGYTLVMVGLSSGVAHLVGEPAQTRGSMVLASSFPNAGNYGIPLSAFAFGAVGRSTAVIYIAAQAVLMYSLGVYIASRGTAASAKAAVRSIGKLPLIYAVALAGVLRYLDAVPSTDTALMETVRLTGDSAIPVMLLLLGIQLANAAPAGAIGRVWEAAGLKLFVGPAVGVAFAVGLGLDGAVARTFVLECAAPAAVTPLLLVTEFADEPESGLSAPAYVSTAIFVTTLASVVTLTVLLAVLQGGWLV